MAEKKHPETALQIEVERQDTLDTNTDAYVTDFLQGLSDIPMIPPIDLRTQESAQASLELLKEVTTELERPSTAVEGD